mgnify:CR=1 FL=1
MTDNFENYREFINICGGLPDNNDKGTLDKYYTIELIRRGKDNPELPGANYHFKNYYIFSWHDYEKYKQEIKDVCTLLKLRAYCSVNYKSISQVALDTLAESAQRVAVHDFKKFYNIFESCSGKYVGKGNQLWIVDIDNANDWKVNKIAEYVNTMQSGFIRNVVYVMPTKSGVHLITHPFNLQQFEEGFDKHIMSLGIEHPDIKKNHITLLYENL